MTLAIHALRATELLLLASGVVSEQAEQALNCQRFAPTHDRQQRECGECGSARTPEGVGQGEAREAARLGARPPSAALGHSKCSAQVTTLADRPTKGRIRLHSSLRWLLVRWRRGSETSLWLSLPRRCSCRLTSVVSVARLWRGWCGKARLHTARAAPHPGWCFTSTSTRRSSCAIR